MNRTALAGILILIFIFVASTAACTLGTPPTSPSVVASPSVPGVPTADPNVWDSGAELAPWIQDQDDQVVTLLGSGRDAVIHVEIGQAPTLLRGPDLEAQSRSVSRAIMRYRWVGGSSREGLAMAVHLRPVVFDARFSVPTLWRRLPFDLSNSPEEVSGDWVEQDFVNVSPQRPPYETLFATIQVKTVPTYADRPTAHSFVDIDRIALVP